MRLLAKLGEFRTNSHPLCVCLRVRQPLLKLTNLDGKRREIWTVIVRFGCRQARGLFAPHVEYPGGLPGGAKAIEKHLPQGSVADWSTRTYELATDTSKVGLTDSTVHAS